MGKQVRRKHPETTLDQTLNQIKGNPFKLLVVWKDLPFFCYYQAITLQRLAKYCFYLIDPL